MLQFNFSDLTCKPLKLIAPKLRKKSLTLNSKLRPQKPEPVEAIGLQLGCRVLEAELRVDCWITSD